MFISAFPIDIVTAGKKLRVKSKLLRGSTIYIFRGVNTNSQTIYHTVNEQKSNDPLHGKTLEFIVEFLVDYYGWEQLSTHIRINCFMINPSVQSSLKFLRKTPWARKKVEELYLIVIKRS